MDRVASEIQKAKINLLLKERFFGNLLIHLPIRANDSIETFCTNGKQIEYSPKYAKELSRTEISGVLAHEVMHCVFKHHLYRSGRDYKLWNEAGDYCINKILVSGGFKLPGSPLLDARFDGMTTVQIYNILAKENSPKPKSGKDGDRGDEGDQGNRGHTSFGEVKDSPISTESEKSGIKKEINIWNQRIIQASINAKMAGSLPGGLARLVNELTAPKVSWREVLWEFVQETIKEDYTFMRPNRKYINNGVYLPSLYNKKSKPIVVALDTSGSISKKDLNQAASELNEIQSVLNATIYVIYIDSAFQGAQKFYPEDELKLEVKGGGGTDFRPAFQWVEKKQPDIACMIYLTDGQCSKFPNQEPNYPVLWVTNRRSWNVPFGEIVNF